MLATAGKLTFDSRPLPIFFISRHSSGAPPADFNHCPRARHVPATLPRDQDEETERGKMGDVKQSHFIIRWSVVLPVASLPTQKTCGCCIVAASRENNAEIASFVTETPSMSQTLFATDSERCVTRPSS